MKYYLFDHAINSLIGEYDDTETPLKDVGVMMAHFSPQGCMDRFTITERPNKKGDAKIVYGPSEVFRRAMVYFDPQAYEARRKKLDVPGRWATYK